MKRFVIFSGYNERAIVAFCRQLRSMRAGFSIIAAGDDDAIFRTAYGKQVAATRSTRALDPDDIDRCLALVRQRAPADAYVICPSSEYLNRHLLAHREWFLERRCEVPLVDRELYETITNKWSFRELCRRRGLAVPSLVTPTSGGFPLVAKPRLNITASGRSLYPVLFFSAGDWAARSQSMGDPADYYYEEYVEGPSHYLLYYVPRTQGSPVFSFSQRNILQQPQGKSMLFSVADDLHRAPIGAQVAGVLQQLGFHGLAMVEVIEREGEYVAIELNPRLWGPFQLLLNARTDLIKAFAEESLFGRIETADAGAGRAASYLWLGGVRAGTVWHGPRPRCATPWLIARLGSDVYFRPDTLGLFVHELVRIRP